MITREKLEEIKASLSSSQIEARVVTDLGLQEKNKKYKCCMHNDTHPSMSFDYKHKRFHCFACGGNYDIFDHYIQHRGISFYQACKEICADFGLGIDIVDSCKSIEKSSMPMNHSSITTKGLDYLQARGLSLRTIRESGIKQDNNNVVFVYNDAQGNHIANKYRPTGEVAKGKPKTWFQKGTNQNTLFNMERVNNEKMLVICEGEIDCLSLIEAGYRNAVSVPTGCASEEWIEVNWEWISQFQEVIIWFDNDDAGKKGARNVANRLPNYSVKVVDSELANDINDILCKYGKESVLAELKKAREIEIEGIARMSSIEDFNIFEAEKVKSGIPAIDRYIYGFVMGSLVILTGYNGGGKSTLANQMIIGESIAQGYKVFAFSGELTPSNFKYWLYTTIANKQDMMESITKEGTSYLKIKEHAKYQITQWIDNKLFLYDKYDYSEDQLMKVMEALAKRKGVKVFLLDNLMKIELKNAEKNELIAQKYFVNRLKQFAVKYNAVVHLCCHPRKPQVGQVALNKFEISGSGDITNLADYIIGIQRATVEQKRIYEKYIEIVENGGVWNKDPIVNPRDATIYLFKDRPVGTGDKEATLYFDNQQKRFYSTEKELNRDYGYQEVYSQEKLDCIELENKKFDKWFYEM